MNVTFNLATFGDGTVFTVLKGAEFYFFSDCKGYHREGIMPLMSIYYKNFGSIEQ